jgi:hypothetical protein
MDPSSRHLIKTDREPHRRCATPSRSGQRTATTIGRIVRATGRHAGEERRSQGRLVAEIVAPTEPRERAAPGT